MRPSYSTIETGIQMPHRFACRSPNLSLRWLISDQSEQGGSIDRRLHRPGTIENIGSGRASKWKLVLRIKQGIQGRPAGFGNLLGLAPNQLNHLNASEH